MSVVFILGFNVGWACGILVYLGVRNLVECILDCWEEKQNEEA